MEVIFPKGSYDDTSKLSPSSAHGTCLQRIPCLLAPLSSCLGSSDSFGYLLPQAGGDTAVGQALEPVVCDALALLLSLCVILFGNH